VLYPDRVAGLILLAPAVALTEDWQKLPNTETGAIEIPSKWVPEGFIRIGPQFLTDMEYSGSSTQGGRGESAGEIGVDEDEDVLRGYPTPPTKTTCDDESVTSITGGLYLDHGETSTTGLIRAENTGCPSIDLLVTRLVDSMRRSKRIIPIYCAHGDQDDVLDWRTTENFMNRLQRCIDDPSKISQPSNFLFRAIKNGDHRLADDISNIYDEALPFLKRNCCN